MQAVKRIFRYLCGTMGHGPQLPSSLDPSLLDPWS